MSGPSTEPWGTPARQEKRLDEWEPIRTTWDLPVRCDWTHVRAEPVRPKLWALVYGGVLNDQYGSVAYCGRASDQRIVDTRFDSRPGSCRVKTCMYACMHACMHACMYVCMHVCMYLCIYVCIMYLCMNMYVCMYTVSQKGFHQTHGGNVAKSQPIFKIILPLERERNV